MTTLFFIAAAALLLYGAFYTMAEWLREQGREEERSSQAKADAELQRKQAEIIAGKRTIEDVARDLDAGDY